LVAVGIPVFEGEAARVLVSEGDGCATDLADDAPGLVFAAGRVV
jgi:hypothetical protein